MVGKATRTYIWGLARLKPDMAGEIGAKADLEGIWRSLSCMKVLRDVDTIEEVCEASETF